MDSFFGIFYFYGSMVHCFSIFKKLDVNNSGIQSERMSKLFCNSSAVYAKIAIHVHNWNTFECPNIDSF